VRLLFCSGFGTGADGTPTFLLWQLIHVHASVNSGRLRPVPALRQTSSSRVANRHPGATPVRSRAPSLPCLLLSFQHLSADVQFLLINVGLDMQHLPITLACQEPTRL
jgi:hypothetical protein